MNNFRYVSEKEKNTVGLEVILKLNREREEIKNAVTQFCEIASLIDGGITKNWPRREQKRYTICVSRMRKLASQIGLENVKKIVATNMAGFYMNYQEENLLRFKRELEAEFNITSMDDLDLRYYVESRDYFIFWESVLFLLSHIDLNDVSN